MTAVGFVIWEGGEVGSLVWSDHGGCILPSRDAPSEVVRLARVEVDTRSGES